jgi:hypothetical protein
MKRLTRHGSQVLGERQQVAGTDIVVTFIDLRNGAIQSGGAEEHGRAIEKVL